MFFGFFLLFEANVHIWCWKLVRNSSGSRAVLVMHLSGVSSSATEVIMGEKIKLKHNSVFTIPAAVQKGRAASFSLQSTKGLCCLSGLDVLRLMLLFRSVTVHKIQFLESHFWLLRDWEKELTFAFTGPSEYFQCWLKFKGSLETNNSSGLQQHANSPPQRYLILHNVLPKRGIVWLSRFCMKTFNPGVSNSWPVGQNRHHRRVQSDPGPSSARCEHYSEIMNCNCSGTALHYLIEEVGSKTLFSRSKRSIPGGFV